MVLCGTYFYCGQAGPIRALEELEIYPEDGQVVISRRITENRSSSRINGETCTAARIRTAAALLLDIHGQHEHQSLLYPEHRIGDSGQLRERRDRSAS